MAEKPERREFEVTLINGQKVKLTTRTPINQEVQDSDFEYSKTFNKAIMNGILPQSRLMASFVENGVWGDEKEKSIEDTRQKVNVLEKELLAAPEAEKNMIAKTLKLERDKLFVARQERTDLVAHSAEARADEAQRNYIVSRVTELASSSGTRVWPTHRDFIDEKDGGLVFRAVYEYLTYANGLDSDFVSKLPENQQLAVKEPAAPVPMQEVKEVEPAAAEKK
jgi:hypothetical protein